MKEWLDENNNRHIENETTGKEIILEPSTEPVSAEEEAYLEYLKARTDLANFERQLKQEAMWREEENRERMKTILIVFGFLMGALVIGMFIYMFVALSGIQY